MPKDSDSPITASKSPSTVTHAFSLNDPSLAWLILKAPKGKSKIMENRNFRMQTGWIAVATTATAHMSVVTEVALKKKFPSFPSSFAKSMQNGCVHGVCKIGHTLPAKLAEGNEWYVDPYKVANVITEVIWFDEAIPARGNFGCWPLNECVGKVQLAAHTAELSGKRNTTDGEEQLPPKEGCWEGIRVDGTPKVSPAPKAKAPKAQGKAPAKKPVPTIQKAKPQARASAKPATASPPLKKAAGKKPAKTLAEKEIAASIKDMEWCAKAMPETHGLDVVAKELAEQMPKWVAANKAKAAEASGKGDIRSFFGAK